MRVRLLSKRDIDEAKQKDRAREAAEGLKLTRRVDGLRELAVETEANYEKYRSETLEEIGKQIDSKQKEMEFLDSGIKAKRKELGNLAGDLDQAFLYFVTTERKQIEETNKANEKLALQLREKVLTADEAKDLSLSEAKDYVEKKTTYERLAASAKEAEEKAIHTLDKARNDAQIIVYQAELKGTQAEKRLTKVLEMEQNVLLKQESLKKQEQELTRREYAVLAKELQFNSPVQKL